MKYPYEVAPIKLPEQPSDALASVAARKVLQLYTLIHDEHNLKSEAVVAQLLEFHKNREVYVAHAKGLPNMVYGFISYSYDSEYANIHLQHLAVEPLKRARGIGSALLRTVEEIAVSRDVSSITVHSMPSAKGFYKKHDYQAVPAENEQSGVFQLRLPRL